MLSLQQATTALTNLAQQPSITLAQVQSILDQVSAKGPSPNGILYSGNLSDGQRMGDIANNISQEHGDLSTIDQTDVGQILFSKGTAANQALRATLENVVLADNPNIDQLSI